MNRPSLALDLAACAAAACLVLGVAATRIDTSRIYVSALSTSMNDQVNHIGIARTFAETGRLGSPLVYPAALGPLATKTYVYMPGYHWVSAAFYRVLGYSDRVALLPSACAYVAAALLLLLIGRETGDAMLGRVAAFLFLAFPANVVYALSAMSDMCLVAATLLAFYGYLRAPPRLRPLLGSLLVLIPVLVRETGALLSGVFALLILLRDPSPLAVRLRRAVLLVGLAGLLLFAVLHADFAAGRPLLQRQAMFTDSWSAISSDAVAYRAIVVDWSRVPAIFVQRAPATLPYLLHAQGFPAIAMRVMLAGIPLGLVAFAWRRDALGLATAAYVLVTAAVHVFHFFFGATGMRMLLPTFPFTALVAAGMLIAGIGWLRERAGRRAALAVAGLAALGWLAEGAREVRETFALYPVVAAVDDADAQFIASLGHDDRRLLAAPFDIALGYVHQRHPVQWAFVPANPPTLALLAARYDVGTIVLPADDPLVDVLPAFGFTQVDERIHRGNRFAIWRGRPRSPAAP